MNKTLGKKNIQHFPNTAFKRYCILILQWLWFKEVVLSKYFKQKRIPELDAGVPVPVVNLPWPTRLSSQTAM